MRVLLIGATGTFGERLARLVEEDVELVLAARGRARLEALAGELGAEWQQLDRNAPLGGQVEGAVDVVVDAAGPFHAESSPEVVGWCLAEGVDYLDFSDSSAWSAGLMELDAEAHAAGIAVVTGLSTYPGVSGAAVEALREGREVSRIEAGIAPGPEVAIGRSVVESIARQAGERVVPVRRRGRVKRIKGLLRVGSKERIISVPGEPPLRELRFVAVDAPDAYVQEVEWLQCGAAVRPQWLQGLLSGVARLRAWRLVPSLTGLAPLMHRVQAALPKRRGRGGMYVRASGEGWGATWHLLAPGHVGPKIPALPAASVLRDLAAGRRLPSGVRWGTEPFGEPLRLEAMKGDMVRLGIVHGIRREGEVDVYPVTMGESFATLAPEVQDLHRIGKRSVFAGRARIVRGRNPLSWGVAELFGFPDAGEDVPVTVTLSRKGYREVWERNFGGAVTRSTQEVQDTVIVERFGPVAVRLLPVAREGRMHLETLGWSVLGVPLPKALAPGGVIFEEARDGRFHFHVDLRAPGFGRIVFYEGWLERVEAAAKTGLITALSRGHHE